MLVKCIIGNCYTAICHRLPLYNIIIGTMVLFFDAKIVFCSHNTMKLIWSKEL